MVGLGEFELELDGESVTRRYERGDVVLLPAGATRVDMLEGRARVHSRRMICRSWGTTPPTTVRGGSPTFSFDEPRASHLLQGLPTLIELRGAGDRSLVWLDVSSQMLMSKKAGRLASGMDFSRTCGTARRADRRVTSPRNVWVLGRR